MPTRMLQVGKIRTNGGTQPRSALNDEVLADYTERWKAGEKFPPVECTYDGSTYWLWDGFHRVESARQAGIREIEVKVTQGNVLLAQWLSFSANKAHGLRRTNEEKQEAVKHALLHEMGTGKSDRDIAKHCGVSPATVWRWRKDLETTGTLCQSSSSFRQGSDGRVYDTTKVREANTARAQKPSSAPKPEPPDEPEEDAPPTVVVLEKSPQAATNGKQEPTASLLHDSLDHVIPALARPVFEKLTVPFTAMRQLMIAMRTEWNQLGNLLKQHPEVKGFKGYLSVKGTMENDIPLIIRQLHDCLPYATCPYCKCTETDCRVCGGSGVVTEGQYTQAPSQLKKNSSLTLKELNAREGVSA